MNMKKALVTGASGGIGLEMARILALKGYQVTGVARNLDKLDSEFKTFTGQGHQTLQADLSTPGGIAEIEKHCDGSYDVWVNNAGRGIYGDFLGSSIDDQEAMLVLNVNSLFRLSRAYLESAKPGSALINVASVLGFTSYSNACAYAATKGFVVNLCQGLWNEYRKKDILVQAFCPGPTSSSFHEVAGGNTRAIPSFMMQSCENVAEEFYAGLKSRVGPVVISGPTNRFWVVITRLLGPRFTALMQGSVSMN